MNYHIKLREVIMRSGLDMEAWTKFRDRIPPTNKARLKATKMLVAIHRCDKKLLSRPDDRSVFQYAIQCLAR